MKNKSNNINNNDNIKIIIKIMRSTAKIIATTIV